MATEFDLCSVAIVGESKTLQCGAKPNTKNPLAIFVTGEKKGQYQIKTPYGFHIFIADYELLFGLLCRDLNLLFGSFSPLR